MGAEVRTHDDGLAAFVGAGYQHPESSAVRPVCSSSTFGQVNDELSLADSTFSGTYGERGEPQLVRRNSSRSLYSARR